MRLFLFILTLCSCVHAQFLMHPGNAQNTIAVEALFTNYSGYIERLGPTTASGFLHGVFSIKNQTIVAIEIPFSRTTFEDTRLEDESTIGNPYFGVSGRKTGKPVFGEFGVRLPLAPHDYNIAASRAVYSDYVDRLEAFLPGALTFTGFFNYQNTVPANQFFRLRIGPALLINVREHADETLLLRYHVHVGYRAPVVSLLAGISGLHHFREGDNSQWHQAIFQATAHLGRLGFGATCRLPLDDETKDVVSVVAGAHFSVEL